MSKTDIQKDIDRFLAGFLSEKEDSHTTTRREDFSSQWYEYEEEVLCNFF